MIVICDLSSVSITVSSPLTETVIEKQGLYDIMTEFDPIKQHRTFCPRIHCLEQ
jgi:hypothetical protein